MAYAPRPTGLPSHIRPSSGLASASSSTQSSNALQNRIAEKKRELDELKQLRDLSAGLAGQMQQLEQKLSTLSDGTEAVAAVLGNWNSVLRAIYMASATIPKPKEVAEGEAEGGEQKLPQTLVRIPIQQAEQAQREAEAAVAEESGG